MRSIDPRRTVFSFAVIARRLAGVLLIAAFAVSAIPANDISRADDDPRRLLKQAERLAQRGQHADAEAIFRRVVELQPGNSDAKLKLARTLLKQRKIVSAYDISLAVVQAEPSNAHAFAVLGTTLLAAGRLKEARLVLFTSVKLDRKQGLAWAGFGLLEFFENRIEEGLKNLREAVYHEPSEPDFFFALAQVSARAEQYREAAEAYHTFLRVSKDVDDERRSKIRGLISFLKYLGDRQKLYVSSGPETTTVNFELIRNRPVIEVRINDRPEPLRFVLDTGSGISVISDRTAEKLGIKAVARGGYAKGIGGDGKFEIVYGFLRSLGLGERKIRNVPVYIRTIHFNNEIDGYIGLGLISKYLTTIDYGAQTFSIAERKEQTAAKHSADGITIPLRLTSSGFLSGEVQVEGIDSPLNFIVDTGASVSVVSDEVANLDVFSSFERGERLRVIGAAGVTEDVQSFRLPRVSLGSHSMPSIMAIALDLDMINEASGFEQAGILGGNFLRHYRMTFDVKNSQVTFVPIHKEP